MNADFILSQWAELAGLALVQILWQGLVVGLVAAAALRITHLAAPSTRYAIACAALLAFGALLPLNLYRLVLLTLPAQATAQAVPPLGDISPAQPLPSLPETNSVTTATPTVFSTGGPAPARPRLSPTRWYETLLPWLGRLWLCGVMLFLAFDAAGLLTVRRMRQRSITVAEDLRVLAKDLQERLGLRGEVQVRWLEGIQSALLTGWLRPVILLPASIGQHLSPAALEAILAHEFAHIRRMDALVNGYQRTIETLLFFHPLVWWLSRRASHERELCCDEDALRVCPDKSLYLNALISLATLSNNTRTLALSSHGGSLTLRARHILQRNLEKEHTMQGRLVGSIAALGAIALPLLMVLVSAHARAEERTLNFPEDRSVGALYARWQDQGYRQLAWQPGHDQGWTALGEARGTVALPENTQIRLDVTGSDLAFLRNLGADDLFFLDCSAATLLDETLAPIGHLAGLKALKLVRQDKVTGAGLGALRPLTRLEWLHVDHIVPTGLAPDLFLQFPNLGYISITPGDQSDAVLQQLAQLKKLQFLACRNGHVTDGGLRHLRGHQSLLGLSVENADAGDTTIDAVGSLPGLLYLNLRKTQVTDAVVHYLDRYPSLIALNLDRTQISDQGLRLLAQRTNLENLSLENTSVTSASLVYLAALPGLSYLNLTGSKVPVEQQKQFSASLAETDESFASNAVVSPTQQSSNPEAPKVGLVFSYFTATGPSWTGKPYSYSTQSSRGLAQALQEANFDVYAIVEPGTENLGELQIILKEMGLSKKLVDGFDTEALGELDVIFTSTLYNAELEMLAAIDAAVRSGVGMINIGGVGIVSPGLEHPAVAKITGMERGEYTWRGFTDAACEVVTAHELIAGLELGAAINIRTVDGERSVNGDIRSAQVLIMGPAEYEVPFPALYVRNKGKGRVVSAQWHELLQKELPFSGYSFYVRAINWAAGHAPDATW